NSLPFIALIAFWASSAVLIVTKPNPRGRPVARSIIKLASTTVPWAANASCRSFSVMSKERFPTNSFVLIYSPYLLIVSYYWPFPRIGSQIITEYNSRKDFHALQGKPNVIDLPKVAGFQGIASSIRHLLFPDLNPLFAKLRHALRH